VGLLSVTQELLDVAGVPNDVGLQAFLPLIEGTLKNVRKLGITGALTGPISRGDLRSILASSPNIHVDYVEVVNGDDLSDLSAIKGKVLLVAAVYVGKTRLIDNIDLEV
jgi:pantothenate synthetase